MSVLEEAILKSIQAVSDYVLEDEDAFIEELQAQWQSQKQGLSSESKKYLANAKKRMDELDNLIRGLYESNLSGKLPDRQFQRLMAQYDEEQEQCENRIKELEAKAEDSTASKVDPKRFIALVRKYQNCEVLTDDKVYRDGKVHDSDRINFLARYLEKLSESIHAGADVRGYFHWSLLDNYEWHSGYRERFGLMYVDYATGQRIPKDSAFWYGEVAATNGQSI